MAAATQKIDPSADPASDPAVTAMLANRTDSKARLAQMMAEIHEDNPLNAPDRPLPAPPISKAAPTSQPLAAPIEVAPTVAVVEAASAQSSDEQPEPSQSVPFEAKAEPQSPVDNSSAMIDETSHEIPYQGRGRPRISAEKRRTETSYTLAPDLIVALRRLAAHNQLRLGRTVSTSEVVEHLIRSAMKEIKDNVVLQS